MVGIFQSSLLGVGTNLAKLDTEKINKIIAKPWTADGSNFSSRIWKQKNQLVNELHNGLSQAFIRGTEPYDLTKQISERFKVSKGQAGRLVMTETAYFHSAAQIDAFKELGVKEYEITSVLDGRTSELCRDMDGKHLPISEFKAGITAPPFHCWCRSTTVPYFNDEFTEEETRIARGADDKLYEVPYNMTYRQWEKAFVTEDNDTPIKGLIVLSDNPLSEKAKEIINDNNIETQMDKINALISQYISMPSRYSKVIIDDSLDSLGRTNRKTGKISLRSDASIKTKIHEILHTRTDYSGYSLINNRANRKINEALTEILAESICDMNGIDYNPTYQKYTTKMMDIAYTTDNPMDFVIKLFEKPYFERYNYLKKYIDSFDDDIAQELLEILDVFNGE